MKDLKEVLHECVWVGQSLKRSKDGEGLITHRRSYGTELKRRRRLLKRRRRLIKRRRRLLKQRRRLLKQRRRLMFIP